MGSHPANLALRFILEIGALVLLAAWGWREGEGWLRFALSLGIPVLGASAWGIFAVPNDPSRSGRAPVPIPGFARLLLELGFFSGAVWAASSLGWVMVSWTFGIVVGIHYLVSYDRVLWLLKQ